jgi:hypothetical protein
MLIYKNKQGHTSCSTNPIVGKSFIIWPKHLKLIVKGKFKDNLVSNKLCLICINIFLDLQYENQFPALWHLTLFPASD